MKAYKHCGPNPAPLSEAEATGLAILAKKLPDDPIIIQIGAYIGASTVALLETREDAIIYSVDIKPCLDEQQNVVNANLDHRRVIRLLGNSADIGTFWPYQCNMLFIDGDHRYHGVRDDTETWLPHLKDGGIVAYHDYIENPPPDIKSRVAQYVNNRFEQLPLLHIERLIAFQI